MSKQAPRATSLPTMRGPSTSSYPATQRPKQGTRQHASPNNSPAPRSTTTYQHQTSLPRTTRAATSTTSRPRMSAPGSPYLPSPHTLACRRHSTSRDRNASIRYRSPQPYANRPPTTRPLPPTAPPPTQPADEPRHNTKTTYSHELALDPALSPRPTTEAPRARWPGSYAPRWQ